MARFPFWITFHWSEKGSWTQGSFLQSECQTHCPFLRFLSSLFVSYLTLLLGELWEYSSMSGHGWSFALEMQDELQFCGSCGTSMQEGCRKCRAKPTSPQVSSYTPSIFYEDGRSKFLAGINRNSPQGWCWRGTDNPGSSPPLSRGFILVNSITLDWSGQDKPKCASFFQDLSCLF